MTGDPPPRTRLLRTGRAMCKVLVALTARVATAGVFEIPGVLVAADVHCLSRVRQHIKETRTYVLDLFEQRREMARQLSFWAGVEESIETEDVRGPATTLFRDVWKQRDDHVRKAKQGGRAAREQLTVATRNGLNVGGWIASNGRAEGANRSAAPDAPEEDEVFPSDPPLDKAVAFNYCLRKEALILRDICRIMSWTFEKQAMLTHEPDPPDEGAPRKSRTVDTPKYGSMLVRELMPHSVERDVFRSRRDPTAKYPSTDPLWMLRDGILLAAKELGGERLVQRVHALHRKQRPGELLSDSSDPDAWGSSAVNHEEPPLQGRVSAMTGDVLLEPLPRNCTSALRMDAFRQSLSTFFVERTTLLPGPVRFDPTQEYEFPGGIRPYEPAGNDTSSLAVARVESAEPGQDPDINVRTAWWSGFNKVSLMLQEAHAARSFHSAVREAWFFPTPTGSGKTSPLDWMSYRPFWQPRADAWVAKGNRDASVASGLLVGEGLAPGKGVSLTAYGTRMLLPSSAAAKRGGLDPSLVRLPPYIAVTDRTDATVYGAAHAAAGLDASVEMHRNWGASEDNSLARVDLVSVGDQASIVFSRFMWKTLCGLVDRQQATQRKRATSTSGSSPKKLKNMNFFSGVEVGVFSGAMLTIPFLRKCLLPRARARAPSPPLTFAYHLIDPWSVETGKGFTTMLSRFKGDNVLKGEGPIVSPESQNAAAVASEGARGEAESAAAPSNSNDEGDAVMEIVHRTIVSLLQEHTGKSPEEMPFRPLESLPTDADATAQIQEQRTAAADRSSLTFVPKLYAVKPNEHVPAGLPGIFFHRRTSALAAASVPDGQGVVFLDGSHEYPDVRDDIRAYARKVIGGGFLAGHDYDFIGFPGVPHAVIGSRYAGDDHDVGDGEDTPLRYADAGQQVQEVQTGQEEEDRDGYDGRSAHERWKVVFGEGSTKRFGGPVYLDNANVWWTRVVDDGDGGG